MVIYDMYNGYLYKIIILIISIIKDTIKTAGIFQYKKNPRYPDLGWCTWESPWSPPWPRGSPQSTGLGSHADDGLQSCHSGPQPILSHRPKDWLNVFL